MSEKRKRERFDSREEKRGGPATESKTNRRAKVRRIVVASPHHVCDSRNTRISGRFSPQSAAESTQEARPGQNASSRSAQNRRFQAQLSHSRAPPGEEHCPTGALRSCPPSIGPTHDVTRELFVPRSSCKRSASSLLRETDGRLCNELQLSQLEGSTRVFSTTRCHSRKLHQRNTDQKMLSSASLRRSRQVRTIDCVETSYRNLSILRIKFSVWSPFFTNNRKFSHTNRVAFSVHETVFSARFVVHFNTPLSEIETHRR